MPLFSPSFRPAAEWGRSPFSLRRGWGSFPRQVHSCRSGSWYQHSGVANFFNSIHQLTLWRMLSKRLANAPAGRDLPIDNLSSQFFANVYLDALDDQLGNDKR